jgi:hypothetical protein
VCVVVECELAFFRDLSTDLDHALEGVSGLRLQLGSDTLKRRERWAGDIHRWQGKPFGHLVLNEE